ncbi:DUF3106 domain-containing protein [Pseudoxanthomonas winnipegensis]|jgi:hypothetical protein|uniref:DUF3106 domain-containing protein n=1 Tax=Pseudoxanthomonas winnipegensis TaxID=2480810 RepID=A0A4Q8LE35_9GAMM|nr:DUF3106 domain-containing protein [Pseudoxanthomonas winnipegensis]PZP60452.1 MAG: hypothetical protein DI597_13180 [Pseudoxanthomonas spadix]TAA26850.1 DUF3106 domain-containing protein [Pseudoxanthomonas winnipegensis]
MRRSKTLAALAVAAVLGVATSVLLAQASDEQALTPAIQAARAARLAALSAPARHAFADRMVAWDGLPPLERARRRAEYADWLALDPATRTRLQQAAATLATLPPAQQQALLARFGQLDRSEQAGWRLGPDVGADFARLQPLLAYMPQAEIAPMRAVLRQLTAPQRADLAVLAQRTPPQDRDALRQALIATDPAARGAWLQERLRR